LPLNFRFYSKSFGKLHVVLDLWDCLSEWWNEPVVEQPVKLFCVRSVEPVPKGSSGRAAHDPAFQMALKIENKVELLRANLPEKRPHVFPGVPPIKDDDFIHTRIVLDQRFGGRLDCPGDSGPRKTPAQKPRKWKRSGDIANGSVEHDQD